MEKCILKTVQVLVCGINLVLITHHINLNTFLKLKFNKSKNENEKKKKKKAYCYQKSPTLVIISEKLIYLNSRTFLAKYCLSHYNRDKFLIMVKVQVPSLILKRKKEEDIIEVQ